jgi:hypothetical protein
MGLNARQIVKLIIAVVWTVFVLYFTPGVTPTYKAAAIGLMWLIALSGMWLRRDRR